MDKLVNATFQNFLTWTVNLEVSEGNSVQIPSIPVTFSSSPMVNRGCGNENKPALIFKEAFGTLQKQQRSCFPIRENPLV